AQGQNRTASAADWRLAQGCAGGIRGGCATSHGRRGRDDCRCRFLARSHSCIHVEPGLRPLRAYRKLTANPESWSLAGEKRASLPFIDSIGAAKINVLPKRKP